MAEQFADPMEEILSKITPKDKEKSSRQTSKATTTSTASITKEKEVDTASTVTGQKRKGNSFTLIPLNYLLRFLLTDFFSVRPRIKRVRHSP